MPPKVLIVEDDFLMQQLLGRFLERSGYQILSAKDGKEVLEFATAHLPQVIVMDVIMPEVGGLEALRQLKRADETRSIPVIIMTSSDHPLVTKEAQQSGAAAVMIKPFSPAQLLAQIQKVFPAAA